MGAVAATTDQAQLVVPFERTQKNRPLFDLLEVLGVAEGERYRLDGEQLTAEHVALSFSE